MDSRWPAAAGRALAAVEAARAFDGVPVREADELGGPLRSCLVGDLTGDLTAGQQAGRGGAGGVEGCRGRGHRVRP